MKPASYDMLFASVEGKRLFVRRCKDLGLGIEEVSLAAGVKFSTLKNHYLYINKTGASTSPKISQSKLIELFDTLGVEVRLVFAVKPIGDVDVNRIKEQAAYNGRVKSIEEEGTDGRA